MKITMFNLEETFDKAQQSNSKLVGIKVKMEGFPGDEVIINENKNIPSKLGYYQKTYDHELNHKFAKGIAIVGVAFGDTYDEVGKALGDSNGQEG